MYDRMTSELTHLFLHPYTLTTSFAHFHAASPFLCLTLSSELLYPAINAYSAPLLTRQVYVQAISWIFPTHSEVIAAKKYLKYGSIVKHRDSGVNKCSKGATYSIVPSGVCTGIKCLPLQPPLKFAAVSKYTQLLMY